MEEEYDIQRRQGGQPFPGCLAVSEVSEGFRRWCLERTLIRGRSGDVEEEAEDGEGGDGARDGCVNRPHVLRQATGEEKKGDLEHDGETLDEQPEWPSLEAVKFALAVTTTLNSRSTGVPEVSIQPLFAQHCDKCSQQRHQQACIQEAGGCDDPLGRSTPCRRSASSGILVGRKNGSVETEEDGSEVLRLPTVRQSLDRAWTGRR